MPPTVLEQRIFWKSQNKRLWTLIVHKKQVLLISATTVEELKALVADPSKIQPYVFWMLSEDMQDEIASQSHLSFGDAEIQFVLSSTAFRMIKDFLGLTTIRNLW